MKLKKLGIAVLLWGCVSISSPVEAAVETFEGTGEYTISKFETIDVGQQYALQEAQRSVVQQAGVYVRSFSHSRDNVIVQDEVVAIASNVMRIHHTDFKNSIDAAGNVKIQAVIRADVDTADVEKGMKRGDLGIIMEKYMQLQAEYDRQKKEIERLKSSNISASQVDEIKANVKNAAEASKLDEEGNRLYYEKRYDEAIAKYNEAIRINPNGSNAYAHRSLAYLEHNTDIPSAMMDAEKAISLDDKNTIAYMNRGRIYLQAGDALHAIMDFSKATTLSPNNAEAYCWLGLAYIHSKNKEKSLEELTRAISVNPGYARAYFLRSGLFYFHFHRYDEALKDINMAISIEPNTPEYYCGRGHVYYRLAVKIDEKAAPAAKTLALETIDLFKLARSDFNHALSLNPNFSCGIFHIPTGDFYKPGNVRRRLEACNHAIER